MDQSADELDEEMMGNLIYDAESITTFFSNIQKMVFIACASAV